MTVTDADVAELQLAELRRTADALPDGAIDHLRVFDTLPEIFAYVVAEARSEGWDEADAVEIVARGASVSQEGLKHAAQVMAPLGYAAVADRLRKLARRKRTE